MIDGLTEKEFNKLLNQFEEYQKELVEILYKIVENKSMNHVDQDIIIKLFDHQHDIVDIITKTIVNRNDRK